MLKKTIKYEDFDGNQVTEDFYFNLSKPDLIEFEAEHQGGINGFFETIIRTRDNNALVQLFKSFILRAYGEKSPDGKRFVKEEGRLAKQFAETPAYEALFMELTESEENLAAFFIGVLPKDLQAKTAERYQDSLKTEAAITPPSGADEPQTT
jgi:hypothetical protein